MIRFSATAITAVFVSALSALPQATTPWIEGKPYDLSIASDRRLAAFDKSHPHCAMWTDWRKLCSRTGERGGTFCRTDPTSVATPSTPFCVGSGVRASSLEIQSIMRFCVDRKPPIQRKNVDVQVGTVLCREYARERPFSGERIDQMLHPACEVWGEDYPGPAICSADPKVSGLPSCSSAAVRAIRRDEPFVCRKWKPVVGCKHLVGGISYFVPEPGSIDVRDAHPLSRAVVLGTYCAD